MEAEAHDVPAARDDDGAEDHIGLEDLGVGAVDARAPPGMPDIVEQQDAARGASTSATTSVLA